MPKLNKSNKLASIVRQFPDFSTDGKVLLCGICEKTIVYDSQHGSDRLKSDKHKQNKLLNKAKQVTIAQGLEAATSINKVNNKFNFDIAKAFVEANIPLKKINHPSINKN